MTKHYPDLQMGQPFSLDGTRLENHIRNLCYSSTAILIATSHFLGFELRISAENPMPGMHWGGNHFDVDLALPYYDHFREMAFDRPSPEVWFLLQRGKSTPLVPMQKATASNNIRRLQARAAALELLNYFEEFYPVVLADAGHFSKLPPAWAFGRVVRNAFVHNGISFKDPKLAPVKWHGYEYGHADHGKKIIGVEVSFTDLVILMLEMDVHMMVTYGRPPQS